MLPSISRASIHTTTFPTPTPASTPLSNTTKTPDHPFSWAKVIGLAIGFVALFCALTGCIWWLVRWCVRGRLRGRRRRIGNMMGLGIWDREGRKGKFVTIEEQELEMEGWEDAGRGDAGRGGDGGYRDQRDGDRRTESFDEGRRLVRM
ncbi:hypothetical protein BKA66DRAFT_553098 [Pyrenochaeta sp. MPI-SDFR-AT-0127]|nr:hypothetical protein BKA66DRAFT_553098 [Pyrenochaeta sp. MPI-SDFR-AT-0127]